MSETLAPFLEKMVSEFRSGINAEWDSELENLTLGGALTLRCELEMIANYCNLISINLNYVNSNFQNSSEKLLQMVLSSSVFSFHISNYNESKSAYPKPLMNYLKDLSYFSSSRLSVLSSYFNKKPLLNWKSPAEITLQIQDSLNISSFAVFHLKNLGTFETSRANMSIWVPLISEIAKATSLPLLLIGDDDYPNELLSIKGVIHLKSSFVPLMSQLAMTSRANFFIGSASGVASSAIYSNTPYLIFKDPRHHKVEMSRELGSLNRFPWAGRNQVIVREEPSIKIIRDFIKGIDL